MKGDKSILKFQIWSAIFVIALGSFLHFTFEWSGQNRIIGAFSAVNESTWEHLKLVFFPMLITTIVGYFKFGRNIVCGKTIGVIIAMVFITIFFYTYRGIIGIDYAILNIGSFVVGVILGEYVTYRMITKDISCNLKKNVIIFVIILLVFIIFTYNAPEINLFKDPITGMYGI